MKSKVVKESLFLVILISIVLILINCGGSENGDEDTSVIKEGKFLDSAVWGLQYSFGNKSGMTDSEGIFEYEEGKNVKFFLGDIILGEGIGKSIMTPVDLVPNGSTSHQKVVNICRLLLTLDSDGDPYNGIEIPEEAPAKANGVFIAFNVSCVEFDADSNVSTFLNQLPNAPNLVSSDYAKKHLDKFNINWTLANKYESNDLWVEPSCTFNGYLYAGVRNDYEGGEIWRSKDGINWEQIVSGGFDDPDNWGIGSLIVFKDYIYAAVKYNEINGGEVWRSSDGINFDNVLSEVDFGHTKNVDVRLFNFNDYLFAGTDKDQPLGGEGGELWRSEDGINWMPVTTNGFGNNNHFVSGIEYKGYLYIGIENDFSGCEVWRSNDGIEFEQLANNGFGNENNSQAMIGSVFKNYLYFGTENIKDGAEIWRTDGTNWEKIITSGFGDTKNEIITFMIVFEYYLYAGTWNLDGCEIWRSEDGNNWEQVNIDNFRDRNNVAAFSATIFNSSLYIGTCNIEKGCEILRMFYPEMSDNSSQLILTQRTGGTFDPNDLDGTWNYHGLVSGDSPQWTGWYHGKSNVDSNGNVTQISFLDSDGDMTPPPNNTIAITSDGIVTEVGGSSSYHGAMNIGKDLIVAVMNDIGGGYNLQIAQKAGGIFTNNDIAGTMNIGKDLIIGTLTTL